MLECVPEVAPQLSVYAPKIISFEIVVELDLGIGFFHYLLNYATLFADNIANLVGAWLPCAAQQWLL